MSGIRNLTPPAIAIVAGIITGYYTFHPAFQNLEQEQKAKPAFNTRDGDRNQEQPPDSNTAQPPSVLKSKTYNSSRNAPPAIHPSVVVETPTDELANNNNNHNYGTLATTSQWTPWMLQLWPLGKSKATSNPSDAIIEPCTPHQFERRAEPRDGKS
jgi:hypothetical protein